ncbi:MAG TPA: hypothetical protein VEY93_12720, partial [Longimicrobium sp.]|nr:hypothetical protein [Longimicrobium sp.]
MARQAATPEGGDPPQGGAGPAKGDPAGSPDIVERHFIYQVNTVTNQLLKSEELDPATGERKEIPMASEHGYDPYGGGYD